MNSAFDGLDLVELLDLLEPVPEPPPVSWVPQTIGWVWLGLGLVVLAAIVIRRAILRHRANAYRRAALAELAQAGDDPALIAAILRRAALAGFPRSDVASLTGTEWLAFLDRSGPSHGFADGPGKIVAEAPYRVVTPNPDLAPLARQWIRTHSRAQAGSP